MTFLIVLGIIIFIVLLVIVIYNRLVTYRNRVENAWAQIDVQLKRRFDLIPNLVETVKGYASHEKEIFDKIAMYRSQMMGAKTPGEAAQANEGLTSALKTLFAVVENYPELKANQNFIMLQEELSGTESKIAYARQFYNDTVMIYNQSLQVFPNSIIANLFGFEPKEYFEVEAPEERKAVKVDF
ncbi:MAG TPA: LemA family protein [Dictyoglomaceae bacterium]|nr:LemA family protein [Dictyoglomaceae bacterium]HPP16109.1 LemA family protein [Dictyoglomaceae bacterium]